jgi:hypothetical protein
MRRLFTAEEAADAGLTRGALRWGEQLGRWRRIATGVYAMGADPPTELDRARARVLAVDGIATGVLAGILHDLDGVALDGAAIDGRPTRRREVLPAVAVRVSGLRLAGGGQTLIDLAAMLDDTAWEQALESALHKELTSVAELKGALPVLARARTPGVARIRRVLSRRPVGALPTESLLETLMVQLAREIDGLPEPSRQHRVFDSNGFFVARIDLCWLCLGLFLELDGQHHKNQPVYDARRETAIVAATGWLPGRFTWYEVVHARRATARRLAGLAEQARRRPLRLRGPAPDQPT